MNDTLVRAKKAIDAVKAARESAEAAMIEAAKVAQGLFEEMADAGIKLVSDEGDEVTASIVYDEEFEGIVIGYRYV